MLEGKKKQLDNMRHVKMTAVVDIRVSVVYFEQKAYLVLILNERFSPSPTQF